GCRQRVVSQRGAPSLRPGHAPAAAEGSLSSRRGLPGAGREATSPIAGRLSLSPVRQRAAAGYHAGMLTTEELSGYMERVGFDAGTDTTPETLAALARAHALSIPFENREAFLGRRVRLDPPA